MNVERAAVPLRRAGAAGDARAGRARWRRRRAARPRRPSSTRLAEEGAYQREVLGKRVSVLDLLERYASCELGFGRVPGDAAAGQGAPILDLVVAALERDALHADRGGRRCAGALGPGPLPGHGVVVPGATARRARASRSPCARRTTHFHPPRIARDADGHGLRRHRPGAVPRLRPGARRAGGERPEGRAGAALLRLRPSRRRLPLPRRADRVGGRRRRERAAGVLQGAATAT